MLTVIISKSKSYTDQAIKDGVIEATIDHAHGYVQSSDSADVYSTSDPLKAYHDRIRYLSFLSTAYQ